MPDRQPPWHLSGRGRETSLGIVKPEDILRTLRKIWRTKTKGEISTPAAVKPVARLLDDASEVMDR